MNKSSTITALLIFVILVCMSLSAALFGIWDQEQSDESLDPEYHFLSKEDGTYSAQNQANNLQISVQETGIAVTPVSDGDWELGLRVESIGRENAMNPVESPQPYSDKNLLSLDRGIVTEWYVNSEEGLKQGFDFYSPPKGGNNNLVRIEMSITGDLTGRLSEDGEIIEFTSKEGTPVLEYSELQVWDASGNELPANMAPEGEILEILFDDSSAVYPVTVDPMITSSGPDPTSFPYCPFMETRQITGSLGPGYYTSPRLGEDVSSEIAVFCYQEYLGNNSYGPSEIWVQRLYSDGSPMGSPFRVSDYDPAAPRNDILPDICGSHIVYTSYESPTSSLGKIRLFDLDTDGTSNITYGNAPVHESRIHGDHVVWVQGQNGETRILYWDLNWVPGASELVLSGIDPPASHVEIDERFVVWESNVNGQHDINAYDILLGTWHSVAADPLLDERRPASYGEWVVWDSQGSGSNTSIKARNLVTGENRTIIDDGSGYYSPTIHGDIIAYDVRDGGDWDIYVHLMTTDETYRITNDSIKAALNDVTRDKVVYINSNSTNQHVFLTVFSFDFEPPVVTPPPDVTVEADSKDGTTVFFGPCTATDNVGVVSGPTCTPPSGSLFPLGVTTVVCEASDAAGNVGSATFTITVVDTIPPETSIDSAVDGDGIILVDGDSTTSTSITFTVSGTDIVEVAGFECSLDGAAFSPCTSTVAYSALLPGTHTFSVRAVDTSGNYDPTPAEFTWIIESGEPEIDIDPNTLNLKSKGRWITCYITLPGSYDVSDIDMSSVLLEDVLPAEWGDIQGDTLMVKFDRSAVEDMLVPGTYNLKVSGLVGGSDFEGYSDEIRVIEPPNHP